MPSSMKLPNVFKAYAFRSGEIGRVNRRWIHKCGMRDWAYELKMRQIDIHGCFIWFYMVFLIKYYSLLSKIKEADKADLVE